MSTEYNRCPVCGGISREDAYPRLMYGLCTCTKKPDPAQKHDGRLNEDGTHNVYPNNFGGIAIHANDGITWMTAKEALSLLAWLRQEEEKLQGQAKEQER